MDFSRRSASGTTHSLGSYSLLCDKQDLNTSLHDKSQDSQVSLQYEKPLNVKFSSDKSPCDITGMVLISDSLMIVADFRNRKLKMVDVDTETLVSEITLSSGPTDVIKLPENKLAVALQYENCIQIMSYTDRGLSLDRGIDVGYRCYCVAYCQNKLVVGCNYDPGKLIILGLQGNIIQVFDAPGLFESPEDNAISSDEQFIYVSDYYTTSKCLKLDWQGNVVHRFQYPGYERPTGIHELEDGTLLVCFRDSHNIVRLSSSFKKCDLQVEGLKKTIFLCPKAITYSERGHKLYISCSTDQRYNCNDTVRVFSVRWM